MPLEHFDHYNVVTRDAAESAKFYVDVLGLRIGDRPPFKFGGAWVYCGEQAVLHLVERDEIPDGTGRVDHVAFRCTGYGELKGKLEAAGVEYSERVVPKFNLTQLFLESPDGLKLELTFTEETVAAG
ncbi:MAG: glyoxalase [Rhodospirillaceae bacterium]|jgi:catechol 2,3-dioxygenase-like lactoylglutathione lyase family enzyme|nr:glyoxalase [Rhodospirillaceae bacterium]MBT4043898.1 glyoxalase [Rhodospirillaceae bacterium]MBT4689579.1 glyoxalase [Rhodospirillaceae bacterium]MBT5084064.1 glyoxalase [Rhodospirillaceae bacterium]MBT5525113.1 glyoxalase [Rhodospirillaceae bacterium]